MNNASGQKNSVLKAGTILSIVSSSIFIGLLGIAIILLIVASLAVSSLGVVGTMFGVSATVIIVLYIILMIGPIVTLIFTVRFLKGKFDSKITVGILTLVFSALLCILLAVFSKTWIMALGIVIGVIGLTAGILILAGKSN